MSSRPYLVFAVVAPALLMASIDGTIVAVGLHTIIEQFDTTVALAAWTMTGFQLAQTVVMPLAGKLSDDIGRKNLFLIAVVLFTVGSIGCGLAPNIYLLIVFRVLQALGGGAFLPSATGIVSDAFGEKRQTALGMFTSIFPLGGVVGPNIGGFIIDHVSWRWIFFVNVPLGLLIIGIGLLVLRNGERPAQSTRLDSLGIGYFAGGILSVLYAMTHIANHPQDAGAPLVWVLFAAGIALLVLFVRHEMRTKDPMIEIELLTWRPFLAANLFSFFNGAAIFSFFAFIPYYATTAYGMSAGESGAILTPRSITMAFISTLSSLFLIRFGYRLPIIIGGFGVALSLLLLGQGFHDVTLLGVEIPNLVLLMGIVLLGGIGMGIGGPATQNAALDLRPEKLSAVAGLRGTFLSTGGVLGTTAATLALSQFEDKAQGLEYIFVFSSFLLVAVLPLVFMIPDVAREKRLAAAATKSHVATVEG